MNQLNQELSETLEAKDGQIGDISHHLESLKSTHEQYEKEKRKKDFLKKKVYKYKHNLELADKENQSLNIEKDQTINQIKSQFLTKMKQLQQEVELMKTKQGQKSASYKKMKHELVKLKSRSKRDGDLINQFVHKFENDVTFARN